MLTRTAVRTHVEADLLTPNNHVKRRRITPVEIAVDNAVTISNGDEINRDAVVDDSNQVFDYSTQHVVLR